MFRRLLPQIKLLFRYPAWRACVARYLPAAEDQIQSRGREPRVRLSFVMTVPNTLWDKLRRSIDGEVRADNAALALYAADASVYRQVPLGVVIPRHEGDVMRTLALARENRLPILARGGGTALAGQTCNAAIVLDFSKYMNSIRRIDAKRGLAVVEPGVVQAQLNAAVAPEGLFFAPDPSTKDRCTIGGMIGNNSCGAHSAAHGKTVDNVEALEVALYDGTRLAPGAGGEGEIFAAAVRGGREGEVYAATRALAERSADEIRRRYPKIPRRVSGYNLDELLPERGHNLARALVGSEGTLGVTLAATLRLVPRPRRLALVVLGFDDVYLAADQVPWILEHRPQALEGFDHHLPDFARAKGLDAVRLLPNGRAFLIVELGADSADDALAAAERLTTGGAAGTRVRGGRAALCRRGAARSLEPARVGARRRRAHPGPSAYLAGRRGHRGAAGAPGRLSAPFRAAARPAQSRGGDLLRPLRRGLRPLPGELRFHNNQRGRDVSRRDARDRRPGDRVRRLALGRAWRRPRALGTFAQDVRGADDRDLRRVQAHLRSRTR